MNRKIGKPTVLLSDRKNLLRNYRHELAFGRHIEDRPFARPAVKKSTQTLKRGSSMTCSAPAPARAIRVDKIKSGSPQGLARLIKSDIDATAQIVEPANIQPA